MQQRGEELAVGILAAVLQRGLKDWQGAQVPEHRQSLRRQQSNFEHGVG